MGYGIKSYELSDCSVHPQIDRGLFIEASDVMTFTQQFFVRHQRCLHI